MNTRISRFLVPLLTVTILSAGPVTQAWGDEEQQLNTEQQQIDAGARTQAPRVEALAREFGAPIDKVEALRARQGWGGVTIELAMAQQLTRMDATKYPDMASALTRVEALRAEGYGWGRIARELGFKLGPVVSGVQRARYQVMHTERVGQAAGKADRPNRPERMDRPDRPERPDRPQRPDRPARP